MKRAFGVLVGIRRRETVSLRNNTVTNGASVKLELACGHTKTVRKSAAPREDKAFCRECVKVAKG